MSWGERSCQHSKLGTCPVIGGPTPGGCNVNCHEYVAIPGVQPDSVKHDQTKPPLSALQLQRLGKTRLGRVAKYIDGYGFILDPEREAILKEKYQPHPHGPRSERRAKRAKRAKRKMVKHE